jgi:hypothetical protein
MALVLLGLTAVLLGAAWNMRAAEKVDPAKGPPRYSVVMTDGTHLVVTDNNTNKLHFYAIGPDQKIGDPLTLRGTVDLTEVGGKTITPVTYKKK